MVESTSLEVFKNLVDVMLRDMVWTTSLPSGALRSVRRQLVLMILQVFSNLKKSMILYQKVI